MSEAERPDGGGPPEPHGHRQAVLLTLALLIVVNLTAGAALDAHFLSRDGDARNPNYRRLWPEYVLRTKPKAQDESLVIVISNSQGYGPEIPSRYIYPVQLEKHLSERWQRPVRVVNWSVQSGNATDFIALAAAAARVDPDVTLLVTSPRNFGRPFRVQQGEPTGLDYGLPDIPRLIGYADLRSQMPDSFLDYYVHPNEILDVTLARVMPLWRYRDLPQMLAFDHPPLRRFTKGADQQNWRYRDPAAPMWRESQIVDLHVPLISWELVDEMAEALAEVPGRRIHVQMPSHSVTNRDFRSFSRRVRGRFEAVGVETWDLSGRVEDRHFITVSHMKETGHLAFADVLAEELSR